MEDRPEDEEGEEGKIFRQIMVQCMAENWNNTREGSRMMKGCFNCFKNMSTVDDNTKSLAMGKMCTEKYLRRANQDCSAEISLLEPGENPANVMKCFRGSLMTMSGEKCLKKVKQREGVVEIFTEGAFCMVEGAKNVSKYFSYLTNKKKRGGRGQLAAEIKVKKMVMKLLLKAHCDYANRDNEEKKEACRNCFTEAITSSRGRRKAYVIPKLKKCSDDHLGDEYTECNNMLGQDRGNNTRRDNGRMIKKCYETILMRYVVRSCVESEGTGGTSVGLSFPSTGDVTEFLKVLKCGKQMVMDWIKQNTDRRVSDKIIDMMKN